MSLATVLTLEQVSVINDLKGRNEKTREKHSRNNGGAMGRVLVPQGTYLATYLSVLQELRPRKGWRIGR